MTTDGKVKTTEVMKAHRIDEAKLFTYLKDYVQGITSSTRIRQFPVGQSNPTYLIITGDTKYVLRKKPPGKLLPSAHAIDREFKVIRALKDTEIPVPKVLHFCQDTEIIGTEFFIMEMIEGRVFHDPALPGMTREDRRYYFDNYIHILAKLHSIDISAVGLSDFGRPDGYLKRQITRWSNQYEASKTDNIPAMDRVMEWLPRNLPEDNSVSIVHGDFRPGNTITHSQTPTILSVLDWELATLGHPLADLGYCCAAYYGKISSIGDFSLLDHKALGIPTKEEFIAKYCEYAGRDLIRDVNYYIIFSLFRSAAIIQGVYKRGVDGNASSEDALMFGEMAKARADSAWNLIATNY